MNPSRTLVRVVYSQANPCQPSCIVYSRATRILFSQTCVTSFIHCFALCTVEQHSISSPPCQPSCIVYSRATRILFSQTCVTSFIHCFTLCTVEQYSISSPITSEVMESDDESHVCNIHHIKFMILFLNKFRIQKATKALLMKMEIPIQLYTSQIPTKFLLLLKTHTMTRILRTKLYMPGR